MILTLEEICEAVEAYWVPKKVKRKVKVVPGLIPRFDPASYKITDYIVQYEDLNS